jgi:hypothetical protein
MKAGEAPLEQQFQREGLVNEAENHTNTMIDWARPQDSVICLASHRDLKVLFSPLRAAISGFFCSTWNVSKWDFPRMGPRETPPPPILTAIFFCSLSGHLGLGDIRPDRNLKHAILMGTGFYGFLL